MGSMSCLSPGSDATVVHRQGSVGRIGIFETDLRGDHPRRRHVQRDARLLSPRAHRWRLELWGLEPISQLILAGVVLEYLPMRPDLRLEGNP